MSWSATRLQEMCTHLTRVTITNSDITSGRLIGLTGWVTCDFGELHQILITILESMKKFRVISVGSDISGRVTLRFGFSAVRLQPNPSNQTRKPKHFHNLTRTYPSRPRIPYYIPLKSGFEPHRTKIRNRHQVLIL